MFVYKDSPFTCFRLAFTSGQIDEIQFASANVLFFVAYRIGGCRVHHLNRYAEDGVRSRRVGVHQSGPDGPILPSALHKTLAIGDAVDGVLAQIGHVDASVGILFQFQLFLVIGTEQVAYLLI